MSVTGSRAAAEINLDEFERRLRAASSQQAGVEDPLSELARLVEASRAAATRSPAVRTASAPIRAGSEPARPFEATPLRPSIDEAHEAQIKAAAAEVDAPQVVATDDDHAHDATPAASSPPRRSAGWKFAAPALALAGAAMIGGVFVLKGGLPGLPKAPPFIAAPKGPIKVQPPTDETVAASNDAGASPMKDSARPARVKVVNSEEQPVDLNAQAALANGSPPAASAPEAAGPTQPAPGTASPTPVAATVDTPVVAQPVAAPPPTVSQFPDPKPVRTVLLRPDGTPIAPSPPSAAESSESPPAANAPKPPADVPPRATGAAAGVAQPSTPKLDLPAKPSGKSSARVVVAKTDTTAPGAVAETPSQPLQLGGPVKPEKAARVPKAAQATAEPQAAPPPPPAAPAPAQQPLNPLVHAFNDLVGATAAPPGASAQKPVDPTAATTSGGWAVQLAAPKSEAEAKGDLARLNAKFASALNGATIGVHKAVVNGETVYRLRVGGLSKADAAALCARLKGDGGDCFIAK